ncbi:MAG: hypothetical protein U0T83_02685 [Bacteriovoracaceae bacterium]
MVRLFLFYLLSFNLLAQTIVIGGGNRDVRHLNELNLSVGEKIKNSEKIRGLMWFQDLNYNSIQKINFEKSKMVELLQSFVNQNYKVGFQYLGNRLDFFHGHLLLNNNRPMAVLYHTQERANNYREGETYYYFNKMNRNFIQDYYDSKLITNARNYVRVEEITNAFILDSFVNYYTVHSQTLNPRLLGYNVSEDLQWDFYSVNCSLIPAKYKNEFTNFIEITVPPSNTTTCLLVLSQCRGLNIETANCKNKYLE